ncbi:MAG: hypothetical protein ABSA40_09715 [Candidatus Dormibacteria bacterium]
MIDSPSGASLKFGPGELRDCAVRRSEESMRRQQGTEWKMASLLAGETA